VRLSLARGAGVAQVTVVRPAWPLPAAKPLREVRRAFPSGERQARLGHLVPRVLPAGGLPSALPAAGSSPAEAASPARTLTGTARLASRERQASRACPDFPGTRAERARREAHLVREAVRSARLSPKARSAGRRLGRSHAGRIRSWVPRRSVWPPRVSWAALRHRLRRRRRRLDGPARPPRAARRRRRCRCCSGRVRRPRGSCWGRRETCWRSWGK
jgi:hypothetical protein